MSPRRPKPEPSGSLTVREIATLFEVAPSTVYAWASPMQMLGGFDFPKGYVGPDEAIRYPTAEIRAWGIRTHRLLMEPGRLYNSDGYDVTDQYERVTK